MATARAFTQRRADALVSELELDLDQGICHACLSFVSFAIDSGDPREIARQTRQMTSFMWDDGLAEQAFTVVRRARDRGVADAADALADLERNASRSVVARSIVRRLAEELSRRAELLFEELARGRLRRAPPELN